LIQQHTDRGSLSERQKPFIDKLLDKGRKLHQQWKGERMERRAGEDAWASPPWGDAEFSEAEHRRNPRGQFTGGEGVPRHRERIPSREPGTPGRWRWFTGAGKREKPGEGKSIRVKIDGKEHVIHSHGGAVHWDQATDAALRRDPAGRFSAGAAARPRSAAEHKAQGEWHEGEADRRDRSANEFAQRGRHGLASSERSKAEEHRGQASRHLELSRAMGQDRTLRERAYATARRVLARDSAQPRLAFDKALVRTALRSQTFPLAMDQTSVRTFSPDGHLHVALSNISRAQTSPYWGREIPDADKLGLDPNKKYMLLRHPDELAKAAPSFNGLPILADHKPVSADDHPSDLVIGATGTDARYEHPMLQNSLHFWSQPAIDAIRNGTQRELSCAYHYDPDMTPGVYEGKRYDGIMRNIHGNHVALVEDGRVGPVAVVADAMSFDLQLYDWLTSVGVRRK
jgi:hypothetical protein